MDSHSFSSTTPDRLALSVRLYPFLNEYSEHFKGTVRTPSIASSPGYCLQTAHLEPRRLSRFARKLANLPNFGFRKGYDLIYFNSTICRYHLKARLLVSLAHAMWSKFADIEE